MSQDAQTGTTRGWMFWTGWVLTLLIAGTLLMSGAMKVVQPPGFEEGFDRLGWPIRLAVALATIEIVCAILYLLPHTAVLGAILTTGYLGGAIATHLRIGDDFVPPIIIGVLAWLGVYFREARLRAILPLRRT